MSKKKRIYKTLKTLKWKQQPGTHIIRAQHRHPYKTPLMTHVLRFLLNLLCVITTSPWHYYCTVSSNPGRLHIPTQSLLGQRRSLHPHRGQRHNERRQTSFFCAAPTHPLPGPVLWGLGACSEAFIWLDSLRTKATIHCFFFTLIAVAYTL